MNGDTGAKSFRNYKLYTFAVGQLTEEPKILASLDQTSTKNYAALFISGIITKLTFRNGGSEESVHNWRANTLQATNIVRIALYPRRSSDSISRFSKNSYQSRSPCDPISSQFPYLVRVGGAAPVEGNCEPPWLTSAVLYRSYSAILNSSLLWRFCVICWSAIAIEYVFVSQSAPGGAVYITSCRWFYRTSADRLIAESSGAETILSVFLQGPRERLKEFWISKSGNAGYLGRREPFGKGAYSSWISCFLTVRGNQTAAK